MPGPDTQARHTRRLILLGLTLLLLCLALVVVVFVIVPAWRGAPPTSQVRAQASRYDEVIRMIESGAISGGSISGDVVALPPAYRELSPAKDGQVIIYRDGAATRVLFYVRRSGTYGTWVFMYASDDSPMDLQGECSRLERDRTNWFWFHCPYGE